MSKATKRLAPLLEKDGLINYPETDTSTFIVARKPNTRDESSGHTSKDEMTDAPNPLCG
jgi:hypothetical protein